MIEPSPKADVLLGDMPGYLIDDPLVQAVQYVLGRELQRVEDYILALRDGLFPQNATDAVGTLEIFERLYGLAVNPTGVTVEQRQANVLAHVRKRHSAAGSDWVLAINGILGTSWTYVEDAAHYRVDVTIPHVEGSIQAGAVEALIRDVTPAHLEVRVLYSTGFQVGINLIGSDRL